MNMMPANLSYGDLPEVLIGFRRYLQSLPTSAAVTTELGFAEDLMKLSGEPTILGHIFKSLCQVGQDEALQAYNEIVNKAVETTAVHKIQREQIQVIIGKLAEEKKKSSKDTPPAGTSIPNTKYNIPRHSLFTYTGPGLDIQKWFQLGENAGKSYLELVEDKVSMDRDTEHRLVPQFESGKQVPLNKLKPSEALLLIYQLGGYLDNVRSDLEKNNDNPAFRSWAIDTINTHPDLELSTWHIRQNHSKYTYDGKTVAPKTSFRIPMIRKIGQKEAYLFSGNLPEKNRTEDKTKVVIEDIENPLVTYTTVYVKAMDANWLKTFNSKHAHKYMRNHPHR